MVTTEKYYKVSIPNTVLFYMCGMCRVHEKLLSAIKISIVLVSLEKQDQITLSDHLLGVYTLVILNYM